MIKTCRWIAISLSLLLADPVLAEVQKNLLDAYKDKVAWQAASDVVFDKQSNGFTATEGEQETVIFSQGPSELSTEVSYGDALLSFDFMLATGTQAAFFVQSRYGIVLADHAASTSLSPAHLGGLLPRMVEGKAVDGRVALVGVAKPAGQWQQFELRYRAPRYDATGKKIAKAFLLDVKINGELVQQNIILNGPSEGSKFPWEQRWGPQMFKTSSGALALRNVALRHADFDALQVPAVQGEASNIDELEDFVALGKHVFDDLGCEACHAVSKGETSVKSGPNLYGLFQSKPRDREIIESAEGHRFTIKADRLYLHNSIRSPAMQLAIMGSGPNKGDPFLPVMPAYTKQVMTDKQVDALGAYMATLNGLGKQGPVVKLMKDDGPKHYDPLADSLQFLVTDRVRTQRGPMENVSARSIHVGQPHGLHFTFDPRLLSVVQIWQGGWLDVAGEWTNRGGRGLKMGFDSRIINFGAEQALFAPLDKHGKAIDFSFKEAVLHDYDTIAESLNSKVDHQQRVADMNAEFLGYLMPSKRRSVAPTFRYRVGDNEISVHHEIDAKGRVTIGLKGNLATEQRFSVNEFVLNKVVVSTGDLFDGNWTLPAGKLKASLTASINVSSKPWKPKKTRFDHTQQPLKRLSAKANLPPGYRIESFMPPKDNYGREQLFEALGLVRSNNGTIVVATRTAGIWRIVDGKWHLFAEGIFDSLGVVTDHAKGLRVVVGQKAELTQISDIDGDGIADQFDTLYDDHSYHGNYHSYMHGPVVGGDGAYYIGLNLSHTDKSVYKAAGKYMGAVGGYNGWAIRIPKKGQPQLWASGLRSPAGLAAAPNGELWYAENQGEYVSTSKLFRLQKDGFYGHPAGLVDLPGMTPESPEILWDAVKARREHAVVLFPHNMVANSPGHPIWDTTNGKFSVYSGQIFIGDQTQSNLLRVDTETVDGTEQGVVIPFADGMASGLMRPLFLSDGSMLVGQTGRGWQAKGGNIASLQRIIWDGETRSQDIFTVNASKQGFAVKLNQALAPHLTLEYLSSILTLRSWVYRDAPDYGSETLSLRDEGVKHLSLSDDRKTLFIELETLEQPSVHPEQTARVYHIQMKYMRTMGAGNAALNAYYTLYKFPK